MDQGTGRLSRRDALRGLILVPAATTLTGCSVRLENDAPDLPVLTTQGPPPDQEALLAALRSVQDLLRLAESTPANADPWIVPVRAAHRAQITHLVEVMAGLGIDVPSARGSASPSPTPEGTPTGSTSAPPSGTPSGTSGASSRRDSSTTPEPTVTRLADAEGDFPAAATEQAAWDAESDNRVMLVSLSAARRAAQLVLGGTPLQPRGSVPTEKPALMLARAIRPAVHGFEQIAARTPYDEREPVLDTLHWLEGARNDLGPVVEERERTSYDLPRVEDEAGRRRLARALLGDVLKATASQVHAISAQKSSSQQWTSRVWAWAAADHARWGGPLQPFPGTGS